MDSNWQQIAQEMATRGSSKRQWNLFRKFDLPEPNWLARDRWLWEVDSEQLSSDLKALKLKLRSMLHRDACETVLLRPRSHRFAVCVSTQVGCAVACRFCATGRMGFRRNLSSWEILEQFLLAGQAAKRFVRESPDPPPVRNVVFMGMGEPLHNPTALEQAIEVLADPRWFGLSLKSITVSTAGVPGKMVALAKRFPRLRIALSLHAADPQKRRALVPRAVGDMRTLRETIAQINQIQNDTLWIEIALIDGINDSEEDASLLIDFCKGLRVEVNVIPYNDTSHAIPSGSIASSLDSERFRAPAPDRVDAFVAKIRQAGIFTTHRKTLGESIQAACGQLITPEASVSSVD